MATQAVVLMLIIVISTCIINIIIIIIVIISRKIDKYQYFMAVYTDWLLTSVPQRQKHKCNEISALVAVW